ncbi:hypothetical protein [uncultured Psychroserpens sp.]|uniref:hypothetical protein n=1 Tax=uncultured Psychroserpens sp. TaxID=255436 RepID=UPI00263A33B0|nr:hypothetical protein [uncultured Psychroserpens sp.]
MLRNLIFCLIILGASPFQCSSDEDEPEIIATVNKPHLLNIEGNQNVFSVDEEIIINTKIPNVVTSENNENLTLTDYMDESTASLSYWLYVYKDRADGELQGMPIAFAQAEIGDVSYEGLDHGMSISNIFVQEENAFISQVKFKVSELGTYYIGGGYYDGYTGLQKVKIIPYNGSNGQVRVFTSIVDTNENGLYEFTIE